MAEKEKKEYTPSAQTDQARQDVLDHGSRKPGAYVSKWQQMLDAAMEKILNREKFSYDLNGDALYRQLPPPELHLRTHLPHDQHLHPERSRQKRGHHPLH